jgi:DNA gyrase subunit A
MGRAAGGVMAIKLSGGDQVAAMDLADPAGDLLVVTAKGYAKRTSLDEYATQGRHGGGIVTLSKKSLDITGFITDARVVNNGDEITLISADGMALRTEVNQIPHMGRSTRGATVMRMRQGDTVVSLALLTTREQLKHRA